MQGASHILIVDDHREIRELVSRALSKEGFRVSVAEARSKQRTATTRRAMHIMFKDEFSM